MGYVSLSGERRPDSVYMCTKDQTLTLLQRRSFSLQVRCRLRFCLLMYFISYTSNRNEQVVMMAKS